MNKEPAPIVTATGYTVPAPECPECGTAVAWTARECETCGHEFPDVTTDG